MNEIFQLKEPKGYSCTTLIQLIIHTTKLGLEEIVLKH